MPFSDVLTGMGQGAGWGVQLGTKIGGPGLGTAYGAIGGAVLGGLSGALKKKTPEVPLEDPQLNRMLEEVRQRRRAYQTGTAYLPAVEQMQRTGATMMAGLGSRARTVGEYLSGAGQVQNAVQGGIMDLFNKSQAMQDALLGQESAMTTNIAQRRYTIQALREREAAAQRAMNKQSALDMLGNVMETPGGEQAMAGIGNSLKGLFGGNQTGMDGGTGTGFPIGGQGGGMGSYLPQQRGLSNLMGASPTLDLGMSFQGRNTFPTLWESYGVSPQQITG